MQASAVFLSIAPPSCLPTVGRAFPGIPGAVVCVMPDPGKDVAWPLAGAYATDVLHYPGYGYVVVDPASTYAAGGARNMYLRSAASLIFVGRSAVSRVIANDTARRRRADAKNRTKKAGSAPLQLKRSGCARMTWELPNGLMRG